MFLRNNDIHILVWLVLSHQIFKSSICDFVIKLLGTFSHILEDTALFVRPDYRPQGIWPGKD